MEVGTDVSTDNCTVPKLIGNLTPHAAHQGPDTPVAVDLNHLGPVAKDQATAPWGLPEVEACYKVRLTIGVQHIDAETPRGRGCEGDPGGVGLQKLGELCGVGLFGVGHMVGEVSLLAW